MISQEEILNIQEQFDKVITYSQGIKRPKTDELFESWAEAKQEIIENFNNKLIWEVSEPITLELSSEYKRNKLIDFIEWINMKYSFYDLTEFIRVNLDDFYSNILQKDYITSDITIPKGIKIIKAFKFFVQNKEILHEIQNKASMLIQEDKITGTLCFSVHPLDYLSLSENTHNWRSCHSLDGEYRAGNLSYMLDKSTVICYLRSEGESILPHFPEDVPWNSKKWRMLLFLSNDKHMLFAGRQYPCELNGMLDVIKKHVITLNFIDIPLNFWFDYELSSWSNSYISTFPIENKQMILEDKYIISNSNSLISMRELVQDASMSLHYNDLLNSSCYTPYYCYVQNSIREEMHSGETRFNIGRHAWCLKCGNNLIDIEDSMMCYNCLHTFKDETCFERCECCGRLVEPGFTTYENVSGDRICLECAQQECGICNDCGELYYNEDLTFIEEENVHMCFSCYNKKIEREEE